MVDAGMYFQFQGFLCRTYLLAAGPPELSYLIFFPFFFLFSEGDLYI